MLGGPDRSQKKTVKIQVKKKKKTCAQSFEPALRGSSYLKHKQEADDDQHEKEALHLGGLVGYRSGVLRPLELSVEGWIDTGPLQLGAGTVDEMERLIGWLILNLEAGGWRGGRRLVGRVDTTSFPQTSTLSIPTLSEKGNRIFHLKIPLSLYFWREALGHTLRCSRVMVALCLALLVGIKGSYGLPKVEPGLAACKASTLSLPSCFKNILRMEAGRIVQQIVCLPTRVSL